MKAILSDLRPSIAGFLVTSPSGITKDSSVTIPRAVSFNKRKFRFPVRCLKEDSPKKRSSRTKSETDEQSTGSLLSGAESSGSPRHGEILALLRKIQISVAEGESARREKGRERKSRKSQTAQSVTEQNGDESPVKKRARGGRKSKPSRDKESSDSREINTLESNQSPEDPSPESKQSKPLRYPSSFFRRSPIPSLSPPRGGSIAKEVTAVQTLMVEPFGGMKLSELKNLARARGIKGYSKLNKGQLLELLNDQGNSA